MMLAADAVLLKTEEGDTHHGFHSQTSLGYWPSFPSHTALSAAGVERPIS
jgi:hypothetical protein